MDDSIFTGNPEYQPFSGDDFRYTMVTKSLALLEGQLEKVQKDIVALQEIKAKALEEPEKFISLLEDKEECAKLFPQMQVISAVPVIPLDTYRVRLVRRGAGKYGQNLEYLLAKLDELQRKRPTEGGKADSPLLSTRIPISRPPFVPVAESPVRDLIKQRFDEIVGMPARAASAPAHFPVLQHLVPITADPPNRDDLFSPQPRKAQSIQFTMPLLPSDPNSRPSTPSQPASPKKRKRISTANIDSSHHNLPWTEEEKRRLVELMEIYPEEEVNARRYAKISAAIGTRTAGQVANRVNKIQVKNRRRFEEGPGERLNTPGEDLDKVLDEGMRGSKEYQEYLLIRKQVEAMEADPGIPVHVGFKCDDCGMEPILGVRWRCTKCHEPEAIDLCQECYDCGEFCTNTHRPSHRFIRQNS